MGDGGVQADVGGDGEDGGGGVKRARGEGGDCSKNGEFIGESRYDRREKAYRGGDGISCGVDEIGVEDCIWE